MPPFTPINPLFSFSPCLGSDWSGVEQSAAASRSVPWLVFFPFVVVLLCSGRRRVAAFPAENDPFSSVFFEIFSRDIFGCFSDMIEQSR